MNKKLLSGLFMSLGFGFAVQAQQVTVDIPLAQDNTIYEDVTSNSNGQGFHLVAGNNSTGDARRGLIQFDIASAAIPMNAIIDEVTITLHVSQVAGGALATDVNMHRLETVWGEGSSNAPSGLTGTAAAGIDATWSDSELGTAWTTAGGDFLAASSATTSVTDAGAYYVWTGGTLGDDVLAWATHTATNNGWAILGEEGTLNTFKRFDSGENIIPDYRPTLRVIYTIPPLPVELVSLEAEHLDKNVEVRWETASEVNSSHFVVEHSSDGINYEPIGVVNSRGSEQASATYSYLHNAPVWGINYYRLAQYDKNGAEDISGLVTCEVATAAPSVDIYPNPVRDQLNYFMPRLDNLETEWFVRIFDASGRMVMERHQTLSGSKALDVSSLDSGFYIMDISFPARQGRSLQTKFIKQ